MSTATHSIIPPRIPFTSDFFFRQVSSQPIFFTVSFMRLPLLEMVILEMNLGSELINLTCVNFDDFVGYI